MHEKDENDAFALLVQRHQRRVIHRGLRVLQDYDDAGEVTQEACLAAWQGQQSTLGSIVGAPTIAWYSRRVNV